ncbi:acyltransferase family protein [Pseudomonas sp. CCI1.2]|uniref:acyltransferase family protein n=1 Tax=unclassified Pseudomonas TaxID=196821 RepID=UPI002AC9555D|nr:MULTISPECIES: acyltransferase family protein [unclassified Pseudomonas]MEB0094391.1 acyltransferase family protein [Pseudomonas sp. CCI4.2]MEB0122914.1 acyltransferase family protein [Pseudomonas sp. CCI1.2]WPX55202.1 acyltransferase family protein [Pseudomonas sp. CCI4.2]
MDFRKDINGLRAIAVIAVILFHFNPAWLPGGYAGVDIFFVISGYLITGIIFRGLQKNSFGLITFYTSRARRIIPALAAMCFALLAFGWFYLLPLEYSELGKHVASSLGFFSNFVYWSEAGYFAAGAHEKWLLHTWSLSVEWQFYMIYPIVLLLLSRLVTLNALRWIVLAGSVLGFLACVYMSFKWPEPAFYLLPARAWELLAGGVACLFPFKLISRSQRALEAVGVGLMLASFFVLSEKDVWPGYLALLPVMGTLSVIISARQDSFMTNNPFSQWTGKLSYSLYLWHWPVVVFMSYAGYLNDTRSALVGIATSFALGLASFTVIEKSSTEKKPERPWKFATVSSLIVLVFAAGAAVKATQGAVTPLRAISISDKARFVQEYADRQNNLYETYWLKCDAFSAFTQRGQKAIDPSCTQKHGEGGVFLWGDSHAQALSLGLRTLLPKETPFYQVTSAACKPSLTDDTGLQTPPRITCNYSNRTALDSIKADKPDIVVIAQKDEHDKTHWDEIAARLKSYGVKHVVLMGPLPQWSPSLPSVIANRHWGANDSHITDAALDRSVMVADRATQSSIDHNAVDFVSLIDKLCVADSCLVRLQGDNSLLQIDSGHLSEKGSIYIVKNFVMPEIEKLN